VHLGISIQPFFNAISKNVHKKCGWKHRPLTLVKIADSLDLNIVANIWTHLRTFYLDMLIKIVHSVPLNVS